MKNVHEYKPNENPSVTKFIKDAAGVGNIQNYSLEDFLKEEFSLRNDVLSGPEIEKYTPSHFQIKDFVTLGNKLNDLTGNFLPLTRMKPSFHFPLDPKYFVYSNNEREESTSLEFMRALPDFEDIEISSFCFLKLLRRKAELVLSSNELTSIYNIGFPNEETRRTYMNLRKDKKDKTFLVNAEYMYFYTNQVNDLEAEIDRLSNEVESGPNEMLIDALNSSKKSLDYFKENFKPNEQNHVSATKRHLIAMHTPLKYSDWHSKYHKSLSIAKPSKGSFAYDFYVHSGINAKLLLKDQKPLHQSSKSCKLQDVDFNSFKDFLYSLAIEAEDRTHKPKYLFDSSDIIDHPHIKEVKSKLHEEGNPKLISLLGTRAAQFAYRYSLFANELLHLGSFSNRKGNYFVFSTGLSNIFCCAAGTKHKRDTDPGVPFFFFGSLPVNERFSPVFGDIEYVDKAHTTYFVTSWRRLKMEKLTFATDVFHSTLATGFHSFITNKADSIVENYAIRVVCGLSLNQRSAEFLADFKYIITGASSVFSNIEELILDKLKPPYNRHLHTFLVLKILKSCLNVAVAFLSQTAIVLNKLAIEEFRLDEKEESGGGKVNLPYLWADNGRHFKYENYLDSIHLYVHTIKDPASLYHEQIKSINTILKYNNIYNTLTTHERWGQHTKETFEEMIEKGNMGFDAKFLREATKEFLDKNKLNINKALTSPQLFKPLAHFTSTKAAIDDPDREANSEKRMKVQDALLYKSNTGEICLDDNLYSHALKYVNSNQKPIADMCIKSQYGPKREFYVLDIQSKFAIKFVEEFFKELCKQIPSECISVPGDMKLYKIDNLFKQTRSIARKTKTSSFFVNGDCSKWSASELMESFAVMLTQFKNLLPENVYYLIMSILERWRHKKLKIPNGIVKKNPYITEHTQYLRNLDGEVEYFINMPQNFWMGIMNYTSSFKAAVIYSKLATIANTMHKEININHLEHSDDYVLGIACTAENLKATKTLSSIVMRCGSITDSAKKTVVTNFVVEFTSLFCFNGAMIYPQIKKVKEVTSSVTGFGYQEDAAIVGSRTAEVMRVGCNVLTGLFFQKIHNWKVQQLYSTLPGQRNDVYTMNPCNLPIEAFGLIEVFPILNLLTQGNCNNYRLIQYGEDEHKNLFGNLLAQNPNDEEMDSLCLLTKPRYLKDMYSKRFTNILKLLDIDVEKGRLFLEENLGYRFIKPNQKDLLKPYLECFYSQSSYKLAYARSSKLATLLRISGLVSKHCLDMSEFPNCGEGLYTLRQAIVEVTGKAAITSPISVDPAYLTGGSDVPILFYELLNKARFVITDAPRKFKLLHVTTIPLTTRETKYEAPAGLLIQYTFDRKNFDADKHNINNSWDLEREGEQLMNDYNKLVNLPPVNRLRMLYRMITQKKRQNMIGLSSNLREPTVLQYIINCFKRNLSDKFAVLLENPKELKIIDPYGVDSKPFVINGVNSTYLRTVLCTISTIFLVIFIKCRSEPNSQQRIYKFLDNMRVANGDSALDLIKSLTYDQLEENGLDKDEITNMMTLQQYCFQTSKILEVFVRSNAAVMYNFSKSGTKGQDGKYYGDTVLQVAAMNSYAIYYWYEDSKTEVLKTNTTDNVRNIALYNICRKLCQKHLLPKFASEQNIVKLKERRITGAKMMEILTQMYPRNYEQKMASLTFYMIISDRISIKTFGDGKPFPESLMVPIITDPLLDFKNQTFTGREFLQTQIKINSLNLTLTMKGSGWMLAKYSTLHFVCVPSTITNSANLIYNGFRVNQLFEQDLLRSMFYQTPRGISEGILEELMATMEPESKFDLFWNDFEIPPLVENRKQLLESVFKPSVTAKLGEKQRKEDDGVVRSEALGNLKPDHKEFRPPREDEITDMGEYGRILSKEYLKEQFDWLMYTEGFNKRIFGYDETTNKFQKPEESDSDNDEIGESDGVSLIPNIREKVNFFKEPDEILDLTQRIKYSQILSLASKIIAQQKKCQNYLEEEEYKLLLKQKNAVKKEITNQLKAANQLKENHEKYLTKERMAILEKLGNTGVEDFNRASRETKEYMSIRLSQYNEQVDEDLKTDRRSLIAESDRLQDQITNYRANQVGIYHFLIRDYEDLLDTYHREKQTNTMAVAPMVNNAKVIRCERLIQAYERVQILTLGVKLEDLPDSTKIDIFNINKSWLSKDAMEGFRNFEKENSFRQALDEMTKQFSELSLELEIITIKEKNPNKFEKSTFNSKFSNTLVNSLKKKYANMNITKDFRKEFERDLENLDLQREDIITLINKSTDLPTLTIFLGVESGQRRKFVDDEVLKEMYLEMYKESVEDLRKEITTELSKTFAQIEVKDKLAIEVDPQVKHYIPLIKELSVPETWALSKLVGGVTDLKQKIFEFTANFSFKDYRCSKVLKLCILLLLADESIDNNISKLNIKDQWIFYYTMELLRKYPLSEVDEIIGETLDGKYLKGYMLHRKEDNEMEVRRYTKVPFTSRTKDKAFADVLASKKLYIESSDKTYFLAYTVLDYDNFSEQKTMLKNFCLNHNDLFNILSPRSSIFRILNEYYIKHIEDTIPDEGDI
jgi:hypothetical protein